MSDLISNLQRLGDAEHDDLSVAHDALAEIVRLRILTVEQHDEIERLHQWELVGREWIDKTDWMQSRDAPVRWLGKHRADALREEIERLTAALQYEQHRADRQGTHGDGCADWGPAHYECAIRERDDLRKQINECSQMLARQAATIRGLTRTAEES